MLIISFDAVGDDEFDRLMEYPAFSAFCREAAVFRDIEPLFISNTYPVHASIVTGTVPGVHGIISNTEHFPVRHPVWNDHDDLFRVKTLWQAAAKKGIKTAAVFWPVTARSKTIRYNIPEVLPRPGKSQVMTSLSSGSVWLQLRMVMKHHKLLKGISQPGRDRFATACMTDILRKHKPGLALMHLTAYDTICHDNGKDSESLHEAVKSLDDNLARLLEAAGDQEDVLILTDHSQINIHTHLEPNGILVEAGLLRRENDVYIAGESGCFIECCGGSAFFHAGTLARARVDEMRETIEQSEGFRRFLTSGEMSESGYGNEAFGFCAKPGYCYDTFGPGHMAEHGFPADTPGYNVFYAARGFGLQPGGVTGVGSLLDIAPLAARRLGIEL